ncbi:MAG: phage terminase small subunit P27 family [Cytophagales bacterium]|jgi:P27 family predicted phage terminase small subunit|nr:phage terminase small subunit P27 family [Cytophagales bacterium]MCA6365538.1 phage terminase small subunit P27 family [Cytophagales bacterium]MCA6373678.1 phage terminase small subunit P27 family [Cytophagales bacterium]MCA6374257.1 phage terminase small subunit P27 family [Cytophagales bacterium]MCA6383240.1 phage terminase small subunit P27 family [Cytophagales bacterium]
MILTQEGQIIFEEIKKHCSEKMGLMNVDKHGLEMLANALDQYSKCSAILNEKGLTQTSQNGFEVLRPEYNVMKDCYDKILKASDKYGLNPASRKKIFAMKEDKAKKAFNLESKNK